MEHKFQRQGMKSHVNRLMICFNMFLICLLVGSVPSIEAYKNYTVGDSLGWYDKLNKPGVDYDKWISGKSFSLGDFLIFNTDNNHSVTQTTNFNTYKTCDNQGNNNIQWSSVDPNSTVVVPVTSAVPLTKEGPTYFFSGDYDGEQCLNGQKFAINVTHGKGLPPALKNDDPSLASGPTAANSAPGPVNADSGDDQAAPDTVISTDFNHPKKVPEDSSSDDDSESGNGTKKSNSASFMSNKEGFLVNFIGGVLVFIWSY